MARSSRRAGDEAPVLTSPLLSSLPGAVLVVEPAGKILDVAGALAVFGPASPRNIVGSELGDHVEEAERGALAELLRLTADSPGNEMVGPAQLGYIDAEGVRRPSSVWALNRTNDPEIRGICLLLTAESAYDRIDRAVLDAAGGAGLDHTFGLLAQALRLPPSGVESFFVVPGEGGRDVARVPALADVPGPPLAGPWDAAWTTSDPVVERLVGELPAPLGEAARKAGLGSLSCYPIGREAGGGGAQACLVVWSRSTSARPLSSRAAIDRAVAVATLALSHAPERSSASGRGKVDRDALTGLGDREGIVKALEQQLSNGERPAVLHVDLAGFQAVNDSRGHLAGDVVLRVAARRLASVMRPVDELARIGADEFVVVCGGGLSADQVSTIAGRVVEQLGRPLSLGDGQVVDTGASVGAALSRSPGTSAGSLLAAAEQALDRAKESGRGRWVVDIID